MHWRSETWRTAAAADCDLEQPIVYSKKKERTYITSKLCLQNCVGTLQGYIYLTYIPDTLYLEYLTQLPEKSYKWANKRFRLPCDWEGAVPTGEILLLDRLTAVVVYTYGGGGDERLPTPT